MAGGVEIYRFDGPPPPTPDDISLQDDLRDYPELKDAIPPNPAIPFGPDAEVRAVFDRHIPGIRWNIERRSGFVRRDKFQMHILLPMDGSPAISLALDDYSACARLLRQVEAERPDWYTSWFDGRWLRDTPVEG